MRFRDFKLIESKVKKIIRESDEDVALPSSVMAAKEFAKTDPDGNRKYVLAMAKSIKNSKPFAAIPQGKSPKSKEATFGPIETIELEGKTLSADEWSAWANNPETDIKDIVKTVFYIDGTGYTPNKIWKTEAATGAMGINKGDAAEAILGAAITAKFRAGGRSVTKNDVINILKEVIARGIYTGTTDYQTAGIEDDDFSFKLTLNSKSMKSLRTWMQEDDPLSSPKNFKIVQEGVDPKIIKDLQKSVSDATEYANSNKRAMTAVEKAKADPGKNEVQVISDGGDASQQSSTKVDLKITYDGQPTRLLSLKAGTVKQFGQVSGAEWSVASDFFESVLKFKLPDNFKTEFGFKDSSDPDYKEYNYSQGPFAKLYAEMAKQIAAYTQNDDVKKEYNLVKNVYDGINYHATRGEEGVTLVILSPSTKIAYKELAFDERLLAALELYDLQVVNESGLSNHRISIIGILKTNAAKAALGQNAAKLDSKSILVQLRTSMQGTAVRNIVEMGPLLKELADVEKLDKQNVPKQTIGTDYIRDLESKINQLSKLTPELKVKIDNIVDRATPQDLKTLIKANISWISDAAAQELQSRNIK
jgi:hypothetical protein